MRKLLNKIFKLDKNNTSVKVELLAGATTFFTMAYILAVNPNILSTTGMDKTAVLLATCLASFLGSLCMGFMANLPFVLSAGMGINAFFAFTVVKQMHYPWQVALFAVFVEGIIFILLSLTKVREAIFNSMPLDLKTGVSVGIGLYIAFIGLQSAGVVNGNMTTFVSIIDFTQNKTAGISAALMIVGTLITAILYTKKVKGSIFLGIIITWVLGIICELTGLYEPCTFNYGAITNELEEVVGYSFTKEYPSVIPKFEITDFSALRHTFSQCFNIDFKSIKLIDFIVVVFAFLFVDLFDTLGALIGVSSQAGMLDDKGRLPQIRPALLADAIATTAGAILGTSTTTTFVESSAGVGIGGRTGLTAVFAGVLFLFSTLLAPIFIVIPSFATAPALIMVGFLMFTNITKIKFTDSNFTSAIPAYLCIIAMPMCYSISEGISLGIISYVILNMLSGKFKKISPILYVLTVLFILKYIFL